jgi:hypothetical protein
MGTQPWFRSARASLIKCATVGAVLIVATASIATASSASELVKKPSTHRMTVKQAAKQFLSDDASFATARTTYANAFASWEAAKRPFSTTTSFVEPFVHACQTFERKLDSQHWPRQAVAAVRIFAASLTPVAQDVATLPSLISLSGGAALAARFARDSATALTDSNKLRSVLGVRPVVS